MGRRVERRGLGTTETVRAAAPEGIPGGGTPLGLVAGDLPRRLSCDGELEWIDVVPERRGAGIAKALRGRLAGWFAQHGVARVCVDVEPSNHLARGFHERHRARRLDEHWLVWEDLPSVF